MNSQMKSFPLLRHGQHVRPAYAPSPGEAQGSWGASTKEQRPEGDASGIVKRYHKKACASPNPVALGWIKAVYRDAIEYTGLTSDLEGLMFFWGIFCVCVVGGVGIGMGTFFILKMGDWWTMVVLGIVSIVVFSAFSIYIFTLGWRMTLNKPSDLPIIFDRKQRKVYRVLREEQPGVFGLFRRWPIKTCEYDWDLIDVEHNAELVASGGGAYRHHTLVFIVRKSKDDPTIIDSFQIANAFTLSEELVPAMWEHIRRFMEEGGPHLPTPDEPLARKEPTPSWWQSVGAVGAFGPRYRQHWKNSPGITLISHLILPLSLPMNWLWGLGHWLSFKTAISVDWPEEVKRAVGRPIRPIH